jgi:hypothetical protein
MIGRLADCAILFLVFGGNGHGNQATNQTFTTRLLKSCSCPPKAITSSTDLPTQDIARYEPLSTEAHVRHAGVTGDTVEYQPSDVLLMARRVALDAARREWR